MLNNSLKAPKNIRDLGGIRNSSGKIIKKNLFLRSGHLARVESKEAEILRKDYKVTGIIDLRSSNEKINREDYKIDGVNYYNIPYFEESSMGITGGMGADVLGAVKKSKTKSELYEYIPDLNIIYPMMIESDFTVNQISQALHIITENRDGCILYHCTAGKDRTGVTTALLMEMLDVEKEDIFKDYLYTNVSLGKTADFYSKLALVYTRNRKISKKTYDAFIANDSYLNSFYSKIDEKYGSLPIFIHDVMGFSDNDINSFKKYALLDDK